MIPIQELIQSLNADLNAINPEVQFMIFADGDKYVKPTRDGNKIISYIEGVAQIVDSAIVPVNNLSVMTETLQVSIVVEIDTSKDVEDSLAPVRNAISKFISIPHKAAMSDDSGRTYSVTFYGNEPTTGQIELRNNVATSIEYTWSIYYSFIERGIISLDMDITFDGSAVGFTEATLVATPITDGGTMSDSGGSVQNYSTGTAIELTLSVPALTKDAITTAFAQYLMTKKQSVHTVTITYNGMTGTYNMIFGTSNVTARGVEGIGQSITLIESLDTEAQNGEQQI